MKFNVLLAAFTLVFPLEVQQIELEADIVAR